MADNVVVTAGTGTTVAADEVVDGTLGTVKVQYVKIMDATLDGTTKAAVGANGLAVDVKALPTLAAVTTVSTVTNLSQLGGAAISMGTGVRGTGVQRVTVATDDLVPVTGTITAVTAITNALPAGANAIGKLAANSGVNIGTVTVDATQLSSLGQNTMVNSAPVVIASDQSPIKTNPGVSATANGGTASRINAAASTNATSLKASAGQLYTIDVFNAAAYNVFLKLYNKASAPTVGTDTPVMTIPIQAGGGFAKTWPMGLPFATGIAYAITKLQADSDTTVVVAGDLTGNTLWI